MSNKPHTSIISRALATSAAILAPLAVALTVPVVTHTGGVTAAQAQAPTDPGTDPTDPGTDPTDPTTDPTDPGTDPTDPATDPTDPGTDPTDPGTDPTDPGTDPGTTDPSTTDPSTTDNCPTDPSTTDPTSSDPTSTTDPAGSDPTTTTDPTTTDPTSSTDPSTTDPCTTTPTGTKSVQPSLTLKVSSRVSRRRVRKGLAVRVTTKAPMHVVVKLRGPGRTRTLRTISLKTGTKKLMVRPKPRGRAVHHGKKLVLLVTGTTSDGSHVKQHKTIRIHG